MNKAIITFDTVRPTPNSINKIPICCPDCGEDPKMLYDKNSSPSNIEAMPTPPYSKPPRANKNKLIFDGKSFLPSSTPNTIE